MGLCQWGRSSGLLFALHTNNIPTAASQSRVTVPVQLSPQQLPEPTISLMIGKEQEGPVHTKQFIDDTTALIAAKNYIDLAASIQETFNRIEHHLIDLGMAINASKTQLLVLNPNNDGRAITMAAGGKFIRHQKTLKVLGFTFSEDMKMDAFIWKSGQNLIRSINTKTYMLRTLKPFTSTEQLANIGNMTINSQIRYVAPLWSMTGSSNILKVQAAQMKAARVVTWVRRQKYNQKQHRQELLSQLGWLNVQQMCNSATMLMVRQAIRMQSSRGINRMFKKESAMEKREHLQHRVITKNTIRRKGVNFLDSARSLYNNLPFNLRNDSLSKIGYKRELKKYVTEHYLLEKH